MIFNNIDECERRAMALNCLCHSINPLGAFNGMAQQRGDVQKGDLAWTRGLKATSKNNKIVFVEACVGGDSGTRFNTFSVTWDGVEDKLSSHMTPFGKIQMKNLAFVDREGFASPCLIASASLSICVWPLVEGPHKWTLSRLGGASPTIHVPVILQESVPHVSFWDATIALEDAVTLVELVRVYKDLKLRSRQGTLVLIERTDANTPEFVYLTQAHMMQHAHVEFEALGRAYPRAYLLCFEGKFISFVILVATKPGKTVITCTSFFARRLRKPDRNVVNPALAEP